MPRVRQTKLEINTSNFLYNIKQIRSFLKTGTDIMPVIKDNAYGTLLNTRLEILHEANIKIVGVAVADEGIKLRKLGFTGEILILNPISLKEVYALHEYDLIAGVSSYELLEAMGKYNTSFKIHIEIDTGMGRTGINPHDTQKFCDAIRNYSNIQVEGIYTHFAVSDNSDKDAYTKNQISLFNYAVNVAKQNFNLKYVHCCNSAGIIDFPEAHFNLVRPGIILYGYYPSEEFKTKIKLKPCIKLKAPITFIKSSPKGTSISYNNSFITKRDNSIIATISIGYGDGIRRSLSNGGHVIINGKFAPIIGTICMDCFMVDITGIPNVKVGDYAYLWDNTLITVEDIAKIYNTINYEVFTPLSSRILRTFVK